MATFYFNAAVNNDWATLGNWWMAYNAGTNTHSVPATGLPTSTDSIEVRGNIETNSGSDPTVVNASFFGGLGTYNSISITVTGNCNFNGAFANYSTITGNCNFNDTSSNYGGTISGDCNFNDSSFSFYSTITGNCNFNDSSTISGVSTITGNCNFNDISYNTSFGGITITGNCTFNNSSRNNGVITGDCTFNGSSSNGGPNYMGVVNGDCTFNDNATNYWIGTNEWGTITFYVGTVNGNCTFSLSSAALHIDKALAQIQNSTDSIFGTIDFEYEKGINGSSILGIV